MKKQNSSNHHIERSVSKSRKKTYFILSIVLLLLVVFMEWRFLMVALFGFCMILPCGVMFTPTRQKHILPIYAAVLALVGLAAIGLFFFVGVIGSIMCVVFLLGFFAFQWVANFLLIKENNP